MRCKQKKEYYILQLCLCTACLCILFFTKAYAGEKPVLTLNTAKKTLTAAQTYQLKAAVSDDTLKNKTLVWKSSRPKIASVSQNGLVKAKKTGSAKITATIKGTAFQAVCTIKVRKGSASIQHYSNAGIAFDYPGSLTYKRISGEDGSRYEFKDDTKTLFWYEQGEKWRADLEQSEKACQARLDEKFEHVSIDEFTDKNINGITMRKVVFRLTGSGNQKVTEYLMTSRYAFFDFYFLDSADDFADSVIKSIQLDNN